MTPAGRGPALTLTLFSNTVSRVDAKRPPQTAPTVRRWQQRSNCREDEMTMQPEVAKPTSTSTHTAKYAKVISSAITLLLLSGACSGHEQKVALPSTRPPSGPTTAAPSGSPSPQTDEHAVVTAYTAFFPAVNQALEAPSEQARGILQTYTTGDYLEFEVRQIMDHQARQLEPWGKTIVHITKVELADATAKVHDCQDASNAGLADKRTHQLIPQSRGTAHRNLIAAMKLGSDGRWRLTDLKQYRATCHVS
jgi:hypothetical protein